MFSKTTGGKHLGTKTIDFKECMTYEGHLSPVLILTSSWIPNRTPDTTANKTPEIPCKDKTHALFL